MIQTRTVSATEAKNRLGGLLGDVAEGNAEILIENHGTPRAAIISFDAYRALLEARDWKRRREAMDALRALRAEVRARNQDLDEEAAHRLVEEISAEARELAAASDYREAEERFG